ncbi:MAG: homoserine dehydrogenase [Candidatus Omnitrophica bacterium]|nr:homoserine dehydrogenase [Candidatus Omnitrophota bacterium]
MITKKVGIIGLGNVGLAVLKSLKKYSSLIARRSSVKIDVVKVCDKLRAREKEVKKFSARFCTNPLELIRDPEIDIVVELIGGIEPARKLILEALANGKDVVTANKALLATSGAKIFSLAGSLNRRLGFEASVCGAIPIIKSISEGLVGCEVKKIYGILNGTTNYILYKMAKENIDFNLALKSAQREGYAEKNPGLDIDGVDAVHKLCILSYLCYGVWPKKGDVYCQGISRISALDITYARQLQYRIKLLAVAKKEKGFLDLRVHPTLIPMDHPLAGTSLSYNAVYLDTNPAGELLFYGEGAGGVATSSSVMSDIVNIASSKQGLIRKEEKVVIRNTEDIKSRYYTRFMIQDHPGVLAKISKILASFDISIASVNQKERDKEKFVPLVIITHEAREKNIRKAILEIDRLTIVKGHSQVIRIEDL